MKYFIFIVLLFISCNSNKTSVPDRILDNSMLNSTEPIFRATAGEPGDMTWWVDPQKWWSDMDYVDGVQNCNSVMNKPAMVKLMKWEDLFLHTPDDVIDKTDYGEFPGKHDLINHLYNEEQAKERYH